MPPSHLMWSCNLPLKSNSYCSASSMLPLHSLYLPICHFPVRQSILQFCMETVTPGEKVQQCIIRFCQSELCRAIGSWVNWIQMNALQVIWILTTAIHVIWIQAVQLKSGANSGDVNPSQCGPAFWPPGGKSHIVIIRALPIVGADLQAGHSSCRSLSSGFGSMCHCWC